MTENEEEEKNGSSNEVPCYVSEVFIRAFSGSGG